MRLSKRGGTKSWATPYRKPFVDPAPMSREEFRTLCTAIGIKDNMTASEVFGVAPRTVQRYWYDEDAVPGPAARLLRHLAAKPARRKS